MMLFVRDIFRKWFLLFIASLNTSKIFGLIPYFTGVRLIKMLCKNQWIRSNYFSSQISLLNEYSRLKGLKNECDEPLIQKYLTSTDFLLKWRFRAISKIPDKKFYKKVRIEGLELFEGELKKGRGIILAASHFGQIELLFSFLYRYKNNIYYLVRDPSFNETYHKNAGDYVLDISTESREETFVLLSRAKTLLSGGNVLFIPGDGEHGTSTVRVDFSGKIMTFRRGFAEFALMTNSAVIPVLTYNDQYGNPVVKFYEGIEYSIQKDGSDSALEIIKEYAGILEKNWSEHPYNIVPHYLKLYIESPDIIKSEPINDFILLQWIVTTTCNMKCEYCYAVGMVNNHRQVKLEDTLEIAARIVELSGQYKRLRLDITGGEILTYKNLDKVLETISPAKNIELGIFTNATYLNSLDRWIGRFSMVNISLHIKYRSYDEIQSLIENINEHKKKTNIVLSQVDFELTEEDHRKLARIEYETGIGVFFQTYIKPFFILEEDDNDEKFADLFINSKDKICAMNCFAFTILPDGRLLYDLACRKGTTKTNDFLCFTKDLRILLADDRPRKCPYRFCYNNYNIFFFKEYQHICDRFGIDQDSRFENNNLSETGSLKKDIVNTKHAYYVEKLKNEMIISKKRNVPDDKLLPSPEINRDEVTRLKQTWSWRIGYGITRMIKFSFFWIPQIKRM